MKAPDFAKRMISLGSELVGSDPAAFRAFMLDDLKKWADLVKRSGIKIH